MANRVASAADQQVLDAAMASGVKVSPRQLERWRQFGAIPHAKGGPLGRGLGRTSCYEEFEVDYIVEYARRARRRRHHIAVVLSIYCEGILVPEQCLRGAYRQLFELFDAQVDATAGDGPIEDRAERLARHQQSMPTTDPLRVAIRRAWERLTRETPTYFETVEEDPPSLGSFELQTLNAINFTSLSGEVSSEHAINEMLHTIWPARAVDQTVPEVDDAMWYDLANAFDIASYPHVRDSAEHAPYALLIAAPAFTKLDEFNDGLKPPKVGTAEYFIRPLGVLLIAKGMYEDEYETGPMSLDEFHRLLRKLHPVESDNERPGQST